jgi:hypothetical protein
VKGGVQDGCRCRGKRRPSRLRLYRWLGQHATAASAEGRRALGQSPTDPRADLSPNVIHCHPHATRHQQGNSSSVADAVVPRARPGGEEGGSRLVTHARRSNRPLTPAQQRRGQRDDAEVARLAATRARQTSTGRMTIDDMGRLYRGDDEVPRLKRDATGVGTESTVEEPQRERDGCPEEEWKRERCPVQDDCRGCERRYYTLPM